MSTENVENRRAALAAALAKTDNLFSMFERTVRGDFDSNSAVSASPSDFSDTARGLIPDPASDADGMDLFGGNSAVQDEDERYGMTLDALKASAGVCTRCRLCETRKNVVFGEGPDLRPEVMVIGEGPGQTEDETGRPFVGKAGQFLDRWLASIGLSRENNAYIANIVKCRPPENRDPAFDEKAACKPYIMQQIALIKPKAILCVGKPASSLMTGHEDAAMGSLRGRFFFENGIPMLCTYHPAAVLRNMDLRRPVWEDLKKLGRFLGLDFPGK